MPTFAYQARMASGAPVQGELTADGIEAAQERLRRMRYTDIQVHATGGFASFLKAVNPFRAGVASKDVVIFSRQMATLVSAGVPLVQGMSMVSAQISNKRFRKIVDSVKESIESGQPIADSLKRHPDAFDNLYVSMVRAGELGGVLDVILERISKYLEASEELKAKVKGALIYPSVMAAMAVGTTVFMLVFVVPKIAKIFGSFGAELPGPTQALLDVSSFLTRYFYIFIIGPIGAWQGIRVYRQAPAGAYNVDRVILRLPLFGDLIRKVSIAKFCRTMATLIKSGVNILESLDTCARASGNKVIEESILSSKQSVQEGQRLVEPLKKAAVFPPMVVQMIAIGEETGNLDVMLAKIADFYDTEVDAAVKGLTSIIEPVVIAFMGIVIGAIVIAMFLPMFQISQLAGGQ